MNMFYSWFISSPHYVFNCISEIKLRNLRKTVT